MKKVIVTEKSTLLCKRLIQQFHHADIEGELEKNDVILTYPMFYDVDDIIILKEVKDGYKTGVSLYSKFGAADYDLQLGDNAFRSNDIVASIYEAFLPRGLYKTTETEEDLPPLVRIDGVLVPESTIPTLNGIRIARRLVNMPGNHLYPISYLHEIQALFMNTDVAVESIMHHGLVRKGFNTLLSVAQGSDHDPVVVVMEYRGDKDSDKTLGLVGKGVTFDSGGISLKPGAKMHEMKTDMGGSAAVVGAMKAIAEAKMPVNVIGIVGLVENMPSGKATRPGDVVTSMKGLTIENHNTDAEGRLVLCDLLTYVQKEYKTDTIIDLATLTGAIVVALGDEYAGLFSNSDDLCVDIQLSASAAKEKYWRMPMCENFADQLKSPIADLKNIGNGHPGSSTAAEFLKKFIEPDVAWAHLDIAGVAYKKDEATGFGVKTLYDFASFYGNAYKYRIDND